MKKRRFVMTVPNVLIWLSLALIGVFVLITIIDTVAHGKFDAPGAIAFAIVTILPALLIILYTLGFKVEVDNTTIKVRRKFGLVHYSFDVTEITQVYCLKTFSDIAANENIKVRTSSGKSMPVETIMVNSDKMIQFLKENVDPEKFIIKEKYFKSARR
jgi:hypothetical protein